MLRGGARVGGRPQGGTFALGGYSWPSWEFGSVFLLERPVPSAELGHLAGLGCLCLSPQWKVLSLATAWGHHTDMGVLWFCQKDPLGRACTVLHSS